MSKCVLSAPRTCFQSQSYLRSSDIIFLSVLKKRVRKTSRGRFWMSPVKAEKLPKKIQWWIFTCLRGELSSVWMKNIDRKEIAAVPFEMESSREWRWYNDGVGLVLYAFNLMRVFSDILFIFPLLQKVSHFLSFTPTISKTTSDERRYSTQPLAAMKYWTEINNEMKFIAVKM